MAVLIRPEQLIQLLFQFVPDFPKRAVNKGMHQLFARMSTSYVHDGTLEEVQSSSVASFNVFLRDQAPVYGLLPENRRLGAWSLESL
jgi:hypothetical protein